MLGIDASQTSLTSPIHAVVTSLDDVVVTSLNDIAISSLNDTLVKDLCITGLTSVTVTVAPHDTKALTKAAYPPVTHPWELPIEVFYVVDEVVIEANAIIKLEETRKAAARRAQDSYCQSIGGYGLEYVRIEENLAAPVQQEADAMAQRARDQSIFAAHRVLYRATTRFLRELVFGEQLLEDVNIKIRIIWRDLTIWKFLTMIPAFELVYILVHAIFWVHVRALVGDQMLWRTERELGAIGDNHKLTRFLAILPMKQLAQILTRCFLEAVKQTITGYKLVRGELQLCSQEGLRESASYYFNQVWEYGQVEWHGCSGGYFERMRERANAGWKLGVHCLCQLNPFTGELVGEAVEDSGHGDA